MPQRQAKMLYSTLVVFIIFLILNGVQAASWMRDEEDFLEELEKRHMDTSNYDNLNNDIFINGQSKICGRKFRSMGRILGGYQSKKNQWPWLIHLSVNGGAHKGGATCGGSLLNRRWILSAAHCFTAEVRGVPEAEKWLAAVGEHDVSTEEAGTRKIKIETIITHPDFDTKTFENDIALLKLKVPVVFDDKKNVGCIPSETTSFPEGRSCYVAGWGLVDYDEEKLAVQLMHTRVKLVETDGCSKGWDDFKDVTKEPWRKKALKSKNFLCALGLKEGADSCKGDSGGPLMCRLNGQFVVYGIVSFGYGCGDSEIPAVYTRTGQYRDWLLKQIQNYDHSEKPVTDSETKSKQGDKEDDNTVQVGKGKSEFTLQSKNCPGNTIERCSPRESCFILEDCKQKCRANPKCKAISYLKSQFTCLVKQAGQCEVHERRMNHDVLFYLYNREAAKKPIEEYGTTQNFERQPFQCRGNIIKLCTAPYCRSVDDCKKLCLSYPSCKSFAYRLTNGECFIKWKQSCLKHEQVHNNKVAFYTRL